MGTQFTVETNCISMPSTEQIQAELERLTLIFSTYIDDSEISRVNADRTGNWLDVSPDFVTVATHAKRIYVASNGAFDPTVGALVNKWGFGSDATQAIPSSDSIKVLRDEVGYQSIEFREVPPAVRKNLDSLELDFSGIAKGFTVDRLAEMVISSPCEHFLVDVGGDVRVLGFNKDGKPWRIGIEDPLNPGQVLGYVETRAGAVATSGTYLQSRTVANNTINHLIDPSTGHPISHDLLAASVLAESAMSADGWATGLVVSGVDPSIEIVKRWDLNALLIEQRSATKLELQSYGEFETLFERY